MATVSRRRGRSPPATTSSPRDAVASASSPYFPPELIPEIASRLTSLPDFFALRAACRAYRALLPLTPSNLASQAPLLLVPHMSTGYQALFHLPQRRIHRFRLPVTILTDDDNIHCFTSFHPLGCRVAIYDDAGQLSRRELRIIHVLTGDEARLPSPPGQFCRVLLSGDLVLAWKYLDRTIQYRRIDASGWRVASISEPYIFEDLIFVKGTLYALVSPGYRLAVVTLSYNNSSLDLMFLGGELDTQTLQVHDSGPVLCLAECGGELMLINGVEFIPRVYHVFRWQTKEEKWARVFNLGGCTLFLVNDSFAGCLGPHHRGIRHDCIYFTENVPRVWREYSLVEGSFAQHVLDYQGGGVPGYFDAPVWVFPSMC
ncbi:hypothetical protein ACP70R_017904 [Stipagrostis hirtigluma subsp. patula]